MSETTNHCDWELLYKFFSVLTSKQFHKLFNDNYLLNILSQKSPVHHVTFITEFVYKGDIGLFQFLYSYLKSLYNTDVLLFALMKGEITFVESFLSLQESADIINNHASFVHMTPLEYACTMNGNKAFNLLIQNGVDFKKGYPLFYAIVYSNYELVDTLINLGVDINLKNKKGESALYILTKHEKVEGMQELLKHGADPFEKYDSYNIIDYVISNPKYDAEKIIYSILPKYLEKMKSSTYFIIKAIINNNEKAFDALLNVGVPYDSPDDYNPLWYAIKYKNLNIINKLLSRKVRTNKLGGILYEAVDTGNLEIVKVLLKYDPEIILRIKTGETEVWSYAKSKGFIEIASFLFDFYQRLVAPKPCGGNIGTRFILDKELGSGASGIAYLYTDNSNGKKVVGKLFKDEDDFKNELDNMKLVKGKPNLLQMICWIEDNTLITPKNYIIMEYMDFGDMDKFIRKYQNKFNYLHDYIVANISKQILIGLLELHKLGLTHYDIKPGNIFVNTEGCFKVADLGYSSKEKKRVGTLSFFAPEEFNYFFDTKYEDLVSNKVDIWSFGITILNLYLNNDDTYYKALYPDITDKVLEEYNNKPEPKEFMDVIRTHNSYSVLTNVTRDGGKYLKYPIPPLVQDFLQQTFEINPYKRYNAFQLLHHPFIHSYSSSSPYELKNILNQIN